MKQLKNITAILIAAVAIAVVPQQSLAQTEDLTSRAQQAVTEHNLSQQLGILEFQMRTATPESKEFGQASGTYWQAISRSGSFVRAYDFFSALAAEQKSPQPNVLAAQASATGAYLGWLIQSKLFEAAGQSRIKELDTTARAEFDQALSLDPDNFAALYGYTIYESYAPNGMSHAKQLLVRLEQLRPTHPMYPWAAVDQLKTRLQTQS